MRLGLPQTVPISHAFFNGLYAKSVPCTDECSGRFQVHSANWIGYCIDAASWRAGTNTESRYVGSDPIFTFMGVNQKLLTIQWKLHQCESDAREKLDLFSAAQPQAHGNNCFEPKSEAVNLLCHWCWVFLWECGVQAWSCVVYILHSAIKWVG